MADETKPKVDPKKDQKFSTPAEAVAFLKQKQQDYIQRYGGKVNYNPHIFIAKSVAPLIQSLSIEGAQLTPQVVGQINALPDELPPINPDYKPEPPPSTMRPQATAETVGEKNARN